MCYYVEIYDDDEIYRYKSMYSMLLSPLVYRGGAGEKGIPEAVSDATLSKTVACITLVSGGAMV